MNIVFIYEDNSEVKSLKDKIKKLYFKLIKKIEIKEVLNDSYKNIAINKIIICIPNYKFNKINRTFMKNLLYSLNQNGAKNMVLSDYLSSKTIFKNELYAYNFNILDGRFLIKTSSIDILKYIMEKAESNLNKEEISIMVNENSNINLEIITNIANVAKRVNLITNNISRFKKLENKLYKENGIILSIGNNRKKGLAKSKYILNIDFPEELLNKYKIYKKAVIVNIENICKVNSKSFSGIVINDIDIEYKKKKEEKELFEKFDKKAVYESKIIALHEYNEINNIKQRDNLKIVNTIGNNGVIHQDEYKLTKKLC